MHSPHLPSSFLPSIFERLEDRVLFDGVPDATFILPVVEDGQVQTAQFESIVLSDNAAPRELIFVDEGVEDGQQLLLSLLESNKSSSFEIRYIRSGEDGVQQITELLNQTEGRYDGIHILSHGEAGKVALGSSVLGNETVNGYLDELASWSNALTEDADILLYGCELAGNSDGQSLIRTVSLVTGADVAASVDVTGVAEDGSANWNLEFSSGRVETISLSAASWSGTLMVEATDGIATVQDAELGGSGTVTLSNNGNPEAVTVINTPSRVGQMLERVWQFNETGDVGRSSFVFDVSGVPGINATIASEFGLIVSDQADLADGPGTTTLVASGYDAANGLVYFHQVDLSDGDYFGLATEVVLDNFSVFPTASGPEDSAIDLGLVLAPSLTDGGPLRDIIATDTGFRSSTAGTDSTDFLIPAGTTGIKITGYSTRDIGTSTRDDQNDDYQFLYASIDLGTETSNGYIGHLIDQGPSRSDQFGWSGSPLGSSILTGGGTVTGDANDGIDPTFSIVDGVLTIVENHQLQTAYHVEFLTNATSSSEFIQTATAVLEDGDQSNASLAIPADADFVVINIADAATSSDSQVEYKGNSRIYLDLSTLQASGVVAAQRGETDDRVINYAFENYDVSSAAIGTILDAATTIGDTTEAASLLNDNQIYVDGSGNLIINRNNTFASSFNSLVTVEYYDRKDAGSSAEQLGESTAYGLWNSDPSNPASTLAFDIPENATLGIMNLTANGISTSNTNENMGAAFAVIDLVNGISSGSIYMVRAGNVVDLVGWDQTDFGTAFFDDPNSISNHASLPPFNDEFAGTAAFNLVNGGDTLELSVSSGDGTQTFRDYFAGAQIEWYGAAPFEISGFTNGGAFSQGTFNPVTGNWEMTIAEAQAGLSYIPPEHFSGTNPVEVNLRIGDEVEATAVTIQAVIDPIDFTGIADACGDEDTDIPISANITPNFVDQDGSETVTSMALSGIPVGHTISDGTNSFTATSSVQSVDITAWDQSLLVYRANPNESGTFTIDLDVDWQDVGGGVTDTDSISTTFDVIVKPVNDVPVAVDNNYTVLGNTTLNVPASTGLLVNDSDEDGDALTVNTTPVSGPSNGSVTINSDGTFSYTPATGFSGTDQFVYQISDGNGGFDTATAYIEVSEPVTGPLNAVDDAETTDEETLVNINVMANDNLPFTGAYNIQSTTPPSNGSILVNPDGTIDYTPDADFFGSDTFTYTLADASGRTSSATVTVTVLNVQDPPVANADSGSTNEDVTLPNIDILANDSDPDNDTLTVTTAVAANGTVVINADGTIDYTPNANFHGSDTVNYTINDGNGGTASSTVLINVVPVSDPPTSADETVSVDEDGAYVFAASDFAFADPDAGDALVTVRIDSLPADGQLLIAGNPVVAGQVISLTDINNGRLLFVPDPDDFGPAYATFDFSVSDGSLYQTSPNVMTVDVNPLQDPPVATDNSISVAEESTANPLALSPPTDIDGDTLTATVTGLPTQGTVFLADGITAVNSGDTLTVAQLTSLVYDAPDIFTTAAAGSFSYDITDGTDTDSGQVDFTITPVNDPPAVDLNGAGGGLDHADTFAEGGSPVSLTDAATVIDEDDTTIPTLKIDVDEATIVDAGEEFLTVGGVDFQLDATSDATTTINVGGISYDVSFVAATSRFDITRSDLSEMTTVEAEAILGDTTYRNDSALPTESDRIFGVCVNDGDVDSNLATSTISVIRDAESAQWTISGGATVVDGNSASYVVTLSDALRDGETASVDLALADVDTVAADHGTLDAAVTAAVAAYSGPGSFAWDGTTLTFTSDGTGVTSGLNISLPTNPDSIYEGDEDFAISLSNPASTTGETITLGSAASVTTTIVDDTPAPTVSIGDGSATEGGSVEFLVSLDVASFEDIVLDLAAASGSATAATDFETTNFEYFDGTAWQAAVSGTQITVPAGETSLQVRIDSVQDGDVEPDETFTLAATVVSGVVTSASDTGTGTIVNDDISLISIDDVSVDEDSGTMTFTISLDQTPTGAVSVDWATSSGTATSGVDFTSAAGTANFAAGQQTQTLTITIADDNLYEGPETFNVDLSNASGGTITDAQGVGTIFDDGAGPNGTDDDRPVISIDDVTATEDTDSHAVFTISLSNPSVEDVELTLSLVDVTAVATDDFGPGLEYFDGAAWQPVSGNVTIAAGATSLQVRTSIVDDPYIDGGETYSLVVARVSGTTFNSGDTGTGTILDDPTPDPSEVSITGTTSVTEGDLASYTVAINNVPLTDVTVTFVYTGTASGGSDYTGIGSVTIPAGSTMVNFDIPTIDDTLGEPLESFTVAIDNVTGGSLEALQISVSDFEVTTDIIDDDVPEIMVTDVIVSEGADHFAQFTVELSNPTYENIDFSISATGSTADGEKVDYGIIGTEELEVFDGTNWMPATAATIAAGETAILLRTPIIDDSLAEPVETFVVTATTLSGTTSNPSDSGIGTIQDDTTDPETILVSLTGPGTVVEGDTTTDYTISLTDPTPASINAAEDVTVTLTYSGTAADGTDFTGVSTVLIPAGSPSATFTLPTVDDSLYEAAESIVVTIDSVAGGGFEGIGIDTSADEVTTLIDDAADIPEVSINDVTAIEGTDDFAIYTIELSNLSYENVDISLSLADGSAVGSGVDFGSSGAGNLQVFDGVSWVDATTATIAAGDYFVQVRVPIADDLIDEPDEDYSLTVDVAAGTTTNIQVVGTGTIIDNDAAPDVTIDDATASEGDPLVFDVTLSNPSSQPIVLDFSASDTTANASSDYNATAFEYSIDGGTNWLPAVGGTEVTIPANSTAVQVRVATTEDLTLESTETMQLSIASVVSGLVGNTTDVATGTITDDDLAIVSIVANDAVAGEPSDNGQFTVTMSGPSDSPTVIAYSVSGAASNGADFATLAGRVTIPAGQVSALIDVSVLDDAVVEGVEDVVVTLTSISSGDSQISIDAANSSDSATISDDDVASWSLVGAPTVNEGAAATYNLNLDGTLQAGETASVEFSIADNTSSASDHDSFSTAVATAVSAYTGAGSLAWDGTTLTFTSDGTGAMAELSIDLLAVNDSVVEGVEDYSISIANESSSTGAAIVIDASDQLVTTEIQDTIDAVGTSLDKATWSISGAASVDESQTTNYTISIDATLQSGETALVEMSLTHLDTIAADITEFDSAVASAVTAYNASGQPGSVAWDGTTLTFTSDGTGPMGDLIVQIDANADGFLEGAEDYSIQLSNASSTTDACVATDPADTVTTTINPDATSAEWSIGVDNSGDEGGMVSYTIALTESFGAGDTAAVELTVADGDTNPTDYANFVDAVNDAVLAYTGPGSLAFDGTTLTFTAIADGDSMAALNIELDLVDDALVEGSENFVVGLDNATGSTGVNVSVSATDDSVTTTINDTMGVGGALDAATWSITGPASGDEGSTVSYTVSLAGEFGEGESASVVIDLNDLTTDSGDYASIVAAVAAAAAANPDVTFDSALSTLTYAAPSDGATMTELVIDLGLATDTISEGPEDFEIVLRGESSSTGAAVAIDSSANSVTTTINDLTDPVEWAITGAMSADEGGAAQYTITLDGALGANETATVEIGFADLTSSANDRSHIDAAIAAATASDPSLSYNASTGVLTFTAPNNGAAMAPLVIDLAIVNDAFIEGPEQYSIGLSNAGSTTGTVSSVSATQNGVTTEINDTVDFGLGPDEGEWSIAGDASVAEGNVAQYTVSLSGTYGADEVAHVDLTPADVGTTSGDYASFVAAVDAAVASYSGAGSVSFDGTTLSFTAASDGDVMTDLVIDLGAVDDLLVEGNEDYTVSISNAGSTTGGSVVLGGTVAVTTTITDNDTATWSLIGDATVGESGSAQYTLALAGTLQLGETATIDLGLADVDTTSADYANFVAAVNAAVSGRSDLAFDGTTLTYTGDGSPMVDLMVEVGAIDDVLVEGAEDFTVSISSPNSTTGGDIAVGGSVSVTTTVLDNDAATWSIVGDAAVGEGAAAEYTVALSGTLQSGETATIELALANVDTSSSDYVDFVSAVDAAVASRSDLAFDGTTLTYRGDGSPMVDLMVEVGAIDDVLIEGDEDFTVSIFNPTSTTGSDIAVGGSVSVTTTILDNDTATWSLIGDATVGEGSVAQYTLALAGTLQFGETATIDLAMSDVDTTSADYANFVAAVNAAVSGRSDLAFDGTTLTYTGDGSPMVDLVVEVGAIDDVLIEGDEDFTVSIFNPTSTTGSDIAVGGSVSVTTTITDNDTATWSLIGDATVGEGASAQYTLALAGTLQSGETATIDLAMSDVDTTSADYANFVAAVNAAVSGRSDLAFDGTTLTYTGDGSPMVDLVISLDAIDDVLVEGAEDYEVSINNAGSTTGGSLTITGPNTVTTTIIDNDAVEWSIVGDASVDEGGTSRYTVQLDGILQAGDNAIVQLDLADLETDSADYANFVTAVQTAIGSRTDLSFDAATGQLTATGTGSPTADLVIDLAAMDDAFIEGPERYQILLSNPTSTTGAAFGIDLSESLVTTTINDTVADGGILEEAVWTLGVDQTVPEGTSGAYSLSLSGVLQAGEMVSVDLGLADIDTVGSDYASFDAAMNNAVAAYAGPGSVAWDGVTFTFTSDGTGAMAPLSISLGTVNDAFAEGPEDFVIALSNASSPTGVATSIDVTQDDAVTTIDDTVGAGADDVTFAIVGDTAVNEGGTAVYTVNTTGGIGAGEIATVELQIADVDTTSADYASFNAAVAAAVASYNSSGNPGSVSWDGTTLSFTATSDGDVLSGLQIELDATDDAFLEGPEVFDLRLANPGSPSGVTAGIDAIENIVVTTINDTDGDGGPAEPGGEWSLTGGGIVDEGDSASFVIALSGNLQAGESTSVELALADIETDGGDYAVLSTAIADAVTAYNAIPSNSGMLAWDGTSLTFTSDGTGPMNDLPFTLDTVDDPIVEGNERFNILLSNPMSTTGLSPTVSGTENLATTTIVDNDTVTWDITGDASVGEGSAARYTFTLTGTMQAGETAAVELNLADVDTDSSDYADFIAAVNTAVSARSDLSFDGTMLTYTSDGSPMADLLVELDSIDDATIEGSEDYRVSISNPVSTTGSDVALGGSTAVTTTIADNDTATWSISGDSVVSEGATAQYQVALAGEVQAGETATIDLSLANVDTSSADYANFVTAISAAVAGRSDLAFDGTTLTFTSSGLPMPALVFDVAATDDTAVEGSEDFVVSISNPGSTTGSDIAVGGSVSVFTTITDNDTATWSIVGDSTVDESGTARYTVALAGTLQAAETAMVDLQLTDVDTTSADYANFVAAVNAAVSSRSDLAFDGTTLVYTGNGNPMVDLIIELAATDDSLVEGAEDYRVSIANPGSGTGSDIAVSSDVVTTTITDNDSATWSIVGDAVVAEGAIASYTISLQETLQTGEVATIVLSLADIDTDSTDYVNFVAAVNSAVAGRPELTFDGTTLTFTSDGNPLADLVVNFSAINDVVVEGPEDFTVSISNPGSTTGSGVNVGASTIVTTTITDDDVVAWSIVGDAMVAEGATAQYTVSLGGNLQSGETSTIELGLSDAATNSSDYASFVTAVNNAIAGRSELSFDGVTLTFTSDGTPMADVIIELDTNDDVLVEGDESYAVSISNPGSTTGSEAALGGSTSVTTLIEDNDAATWSLSGDTIVAEGANAQYSLELEGTMQAGETATIELQLTDVDTASTDYASFIAAVNTAVANYAGAGTVGFDGTTLTFTASADEDSMAALTIELSAVDDVLAEGPEDFVVQISNPSSTTGVDSELGSAVTVTTEITDNDAAAWSIIGDSTVDEGGTSQYTISLQGTLQAGENSSVQIVLADIETSSADYENFIAAVQAAVATRADLVFDSATGTLTATGTGSAMADLIFDLDATDDMFLEGPERYQVMLSNATSTTGSTTGIDANANIVTTTINDTVGDGGALEEAIWTFGVDQTVPEGVDGMYTLQLSGSLQAGEVAYVEMAVSDISSASVDYGQFVTAMNNAVASYSGPGTVSWAGSTFTFTGDGTGPMAPLSIALPTNNDVIAEGAEDFRIALTNAGSLSGMAVSIAPQSDDAVTTIDDTIGAGTDDVTFAIVGDNSVDEGGTANYSITTTGGLGAGQQASVELLLGDVDTNRADYADFDATVSDAVASYNAGGNPGSVSWDGTTLTFTADSDGDTLMGLMIDLAADDDDWLEGPETFDLTLANPSSATGVVVGIASGQASVFTTINDTVGDGGAPEPGALWSLTGDASVAESGTATYSVGLTGNLQAGESTSVQLTAANIETAFNDFQTFADAVADAVSDYNADATNHGSLLWDGTTLTFSSDGSGPMGDLEFMLDTTGDILAEGPERLNVMLANPISTTGLSPTISSTENIVTTTIVDDDPVAWSIAGPSMTSEGNDATFTVALSGVFQQGETASVNLALTHVETDDSDFADTLAAIAAAAASNPNVTFDPATGVLEFTAPNDGASMADLVINLPISSDGVSEGPEDFEIGLSNPTSNTGLSPTIDSAQSAVTTTINGSPVLQPDVDFTSINTPYVGNVLSNDSDPDGDALTVTHVDGQPIGNPIATGNGTVLMNPDGGFTFVPTPGFFGVESFTYTVVDAAGNTKTTSVELTVNNADLGIAKAASDAVANGENWDITFTLVMENLGNVSLNGIGLMDDVAAKFGDALVAVSLPTLQNFSGNGAVPSLNSNWTSDTSANLLANGVLAPGDSFEVSFTVTIDPDAGGVSQAISNQAQGQGQGINPDGTPMLDSNGQPAIASDLSDDGSDPAGENGSDNGDGVFGNDATNILIADLGIAKSIVGEAELLFSGNYVVTYQVVVENTGTVSLGSLSLLENLQAQFGAAFVESSNLGLVVPASDPASSITISSTFDGRTDFELLEVTSANLLAPGDSFTLQFTVEVDPLAIAGTVGNQVSGSAAAVDANGNPLLDSNGNAITGSDLSDSGSDPGTSNPDDPGDTGSTSDATQFNPATLPLGEISGNVFYDFNNNGVRESTEDGIAGVEIILTGTDVYGNTVNISQLTDVDGHYSFTGLNAGIYRLTEVQPDDFDDGIDSGDASWTIGDDEFSNIALNWGQSFTASTFAERFPGTSGFPPSFGKLAPIYVSNVGELVEGYVATSSPIYAGIPIGTNANPLWLVSGRPVQGGYSVDFAAGEGGCPVIVEPCVDASPALPPLPEILMQEFVEENCHADGDEAVVEEETVVCEEEVCPPEAAADCPPAPNFLRGSFLKRMANWLRR
ncbi:Calx-beta domain-containing protein [Mariniblastus fucicola]|uniref:Calx-beta domain-containing protein n=1 Tax=Mariniblastus fucicola TaxID=980251 RepID=UPI0009464AA3|nr:Ig-like domain-containing protein [Mariniblastus fucicola]